LISPGQQLWVDFTSPGNCCRFRNHGPIKFATPGGTSNESHHCGNTGSLADILIDTFRCQSRHMKRLSLLVPIILFMLLACNNKLTTLYYSDTSQVSDGEIFGEALNGFFYPNKHIYTYKIRLKNISQKLIEIKDSLSVKPKDIEPDDAYYDYAFITASNDTLFSDTRLKYWKYNSRGGLFDIGDMKTLIEATVKKKF
jgi:hypothetical protein